jgi:phosphoglucosamine mutase
MTISRKYFGTDGVRGPYGSAIMNEDFAWRLGSAAARFMKAQPGFKSNRVIIGRDTRASGVSLENALAAGLKSEGLLPTSLGVVPTPVVSLMTRQLDAAMGVVLTASHNPASDNGIKFFGPNGVKLTDQDESEIEQFLPASAGASNGTPSLSVAPLAQYIELAGAILPPNSLAGWKIVLDTAHGAACVSSRTVLEALGAALVLVGHKPDGNNINAGVGSQHPEQMVENVLSSGARLGIAHDGDADRCILCDELGEVLDGDEILTLLALHALQRGRLANKTLVATVQSNLGVDAAVNAAGGRVCRTQVGDRYVIERMLAEGATLGGESSGHVICSDISPTGDGLVAALKVIEVMLATGQPLSKLRRGLTKFPQLSQALAVREKKPMDSLHRLLATIERVETELGAAGRVLVRYSGTEPKLRLLVEGPTEPIVQAAMNHLIEAVRADLEVVAG